MLLRPILALAVLAASLSGAASADPIHDAFDTPALDSQLWSTAQIQPSQFSFASPGRCGPGALAITARAGEGMGNCDGEACQRMEIRERNRRNFGEDVWYAFSFRITGDIASVGSDRWVIGQWKEETDQSPYVAQRFDNGVFHITVEDGDIRRLIAASEGDPYRIPDFHQAVAALGPERTAHLSAISRALRSLDAVAPLYTPERRQSLGSTLPPDFSRERLRSVSEFSFLSDVDLFSGPSNLQITPGTKPVLPDPKKDWVDMRYHIRGGLNGTGLVEVWANGEKVVTVTGSIGHADHRGPSQYFKFGHYRKAVQGTVTALFDEFRRGSSEAELGTLCARP